MAQQYLIDIGINDQLQDVVRKCNKNFRIVTSNAVKQSQSGDRYSYDAVIQELYQIVSNEAATRQQGDDDIKETIEAILSAIDDKAPKDSPVLTGTPTAPTAAIGTNTNQIATTAFVTNAVNMAASGALQYKGTAAQESDISSQAYKKGWYYVVATAGTYFGKICEVGDMLIAKQDKTNVTINDWDAVQSNIEVLSNSEIDILWDTAQGATNE